MGSLSQHWSFYERVRWMFFGSPPDRDVLRSELARLRTEFVENSLDAIDRDMMQEARLKKIALLEHEVER